jgi:RNA polymerase sigma factor (sigma-70 family)
MNVHITYKLPKTPDLEKLINQQIEKLGRYLQVFRPDLVHVKGTISENSVRQGIGVSLNLRLPSGQMASEKTAPNVSAAVKAAFDDIAEQVKKHKQLLRNHHKWPRRRGPGRAVVGTVPFEQTVAAVKPASISSQDIFDYIDVNFPRLKRSIERELSYREAEGRILPGQLTVEDVVNEAVANALGDHQEKPERMKLEPWIHRLALNAISELAQQGGDEGRIPLERSRGKQNVVGSDEALLQFHQPDEKLFEENVIADPAANNPEELAARRELIGLVSNALRDAGRREREAFIFYTIEGFTLEEIADITSQSKEEVRAAIARGREHLQRTLPIQDPLKDRLVEYSKSA